MLTKNPFIFSLFILVGTPVVGCSAAVEDGAADDGAEQTSDAVASYIRNKCASTAYSGNSAAQAKCGAVCGSGMKFTGQWWQAKDSTGPDHVTCSGKSVCQCAMIVNKCAATAYNGNTTAQARCGAVCGSGLKFTGQWWQAKDSTGPDRETCSGKSVCQCLGVVP